MEPPVPSSGEHWALFLDLDGTLAELAPHPDDVHLSPDQVALLTRLEILLDGALAVVSGRSIESLDAVMHPLRARAAGLHGLERRGSSPDQVAVDRNALAAVSRELALFAGQYPGLMLEDKGAAVALHFRNAPELESACRMRVEALVQNMPDFHLMAGKMVFEVKPRHGNKGTAIDAFLGEPPFCNRIPVFAGDDVTDEDGFAQVNARDGISIKIGEGRSAARFRLPDVSALHAWLTCVEARLAGEEPHASSL